ncbi:MAG TPA: MarR family winged helix-turn-helix transcriptional regulator [Caulobacteraceae bacterium]|nr:MarR family winged helix-turn-helix transcriptional regulator [Caulobacteraceae bacterium]
MTTPPTAPAQTPDAEQHLFHVLAAVCRMREAKLDPALEGLGLNLSQSRLLDVVARFEPCAMSEAAAFSLVDRTTATRIVDQLDGQGLIERIRCPADRRRILLALSPLGRERQAAAATITAEHNREALKALPRRLAHVLVDGGSRLVEGLAPTAEDAQRVLSFSRPAAPSLCAGAAQTDGRPPCSQCEHLPPSRRAARAAVRA